MSSHAHQHDPHEAQLHASAGLARFDDLEESLSLVDTSQLIVEFHRSIREVYGNDSIAMLRLKEAMDMMFELHKNQPDRKDGQPFVNHPLEVALEVMNTFKCRDIDVIIAALLHDSVEDQADKLCLLIDFMIPDGADRRLAGLVAIEELFNYRVAGMVDSLTNPDFDRRQKDLGHNLSRDEKNEIYREHVRWILDNDPLAAVVKLADFMRNACNLVQCADQDKRDRLETKYGPLFVPIMTWLEKIDHSDSNIWPYRDSLSGLFSKRDELIGLLELTYERDYRQVMD